MNESFGQAHQNFTRTTEPVANTTRVEFNGSVIAESDNSLLLRETRHGTAFYFPWEDVRTECLTASDLTTLCPFKGEATYWSVTVDGKCLENAAWSYPDPGDGVPEIAGRISFY